MIETYWHHARIPGRVKVSSRQRVIGGDSAHPHLLVEDIVLQSLDTLQVQDEGHTNEYPILRLRK